MPCKAEGCQRPVKGRGMCGAHYQLWRRFGDLVPRFASHGAGAEFISSAIRYHGTDCYLWPFGKNAGYGSIQLYGHSQRAHRIVCEAVYGAPPFPNADAAHSCGVRACCNPAHLRWDTRKGNMADNLTHGTRRLGERVPIAKLTASDVIAIRSQPNRAQADLAKEYGVQQSNISAILNNRRWKHLPPISPTEDRIIRSGNRGRLGETNAKAKLTAEQVQDIRTSEKSGVVLAREYSINKTAISAIRNRKTWRHLP